MTSGSGDPTIRQSAYDQLAAIKQQIIDYGNTQSGNSYVFGGTDTTTPPFSSTGPGANTYNGNSTQSSVEVTTNSYQAVNITGDRLLGLSGASSANPIPSPSYGSTDILGTLDNLMAAVGNSTTASNVANIQQYTNDLDAGVTQVNNATVDVAARLQRLNTMSTMNTNNKNTLQSTISNIQSVNLATVGTELSQQQTAYQAALSATSQISKMSLLNYL
jgi:flagellar hook-associated protein 3 FlgL